MDISIENWLTIITLIVGSFAAVASLGGYIYQKKASQKLERLTPKEMPFLPIAKKLYNNLISLVIIYEKEDDLFEQKDRLSHRVAYQVEATLAEMKMPEDMLVLTPYEKYPDNTLYNQAFNIKLSWREYNTNINSAIKHFSDNNNDSIAIDSRLLWRMSLDLLFDLIEFDDAVFESNKNLFKLNRHYLKKHISAIARLHNSLIFEHISGIEKRTTNTYQIFDLFDPKVVRLCVPTLGWSESLYNLKNIKNTIESTEKKFCFVLTHSFGGTFVYSRNTEKRL